MPRSQSPVVLPGDPTSALHAATKQYVDNGLGLKLNSAARGAANGVGSLGSDGKQLGAELAAHIHSAYELAANKGAANGYAGVDSTSRLVGTAFPLVPSLVVASTISTSFTPDVGASSSGWFFDLTVTGDIVIGAPTTPSNHQVVKIAALASGGARSVQFSSSIVASTGLGLTFSVPQGKVLIAALQYTSLTSTWVLTAATTSA